MTGRFPRVVGRIGGDIAGPTLICVALALADTSANRAFAARFPIPAILHIAAVEAGVVTGDDPAPARAHLRAAADHPSLFEVPCRRAIQPVDRIRMLPGTANLQLVAAGEVLARDRHGPVHAPESGLLLTPLYQERGNEGFSVAGETSPVRS